MNGEENTMTKDQLHILESKLINMRNEIENQKLDVSRMQAEKTIEDFEAASLITDQTLITKLLSRKSLYLKKINMALERIKYGEYGECEMCGDDIKFKRLEARPTATLCIACKEKEEKMSKMINHVGILDWNNDEAI